MVDIILGNCESHLVGDLSPYAIERARDRLSFQKMGCEYIKKFQEGEWDGIVRLFELGKPFMTGLLRPLCIALKESNQEFRIIDRRNRIYNNFPELKFSKQKWHEEREYQDFTVQRSIDLTRGILNIGTGGGKTLIAAQIIGALKVKPFMFYVLTKDLLYQAKEVLQSTLNCEIGQIGDSVVDIKDINVCTKDAVIYALHKKDRRFNIDNYKFDSCDIWDESSLFGDSDCEKIVDVVSRCGGVIFDECVSGDSKVETEDGLITISEAFERKSKFIKSYDGNKILYKPITYWWKKENKDTLKIEFNYGEIKCTKNHLLFTRSGWKKAEELTILDEVLFADVDAELGSNIEKAESQENMFLDINPRKGVLKNGKSSTRDTYLISQNVNADVAGMYCQHQNQLSRLSNQGELRHIQNTLKDMINNQIGQNIILNQQKMKNRLLSEPVSEIPLLCWHMGDLKTIDLQQIMDLFKKNGPSTKPSFLKDLELRLKLKKIQDMEINGHLYQQDACHLSQRLRALFTMVRKRKSLTTFLKNLETLGWLGGFAMTDRDVKNVFIYTQKDFQKKKIVSYWDGLIKTDTMEISAKTSKRRSFLYTLLLNRLSTFLEELKNMSQNVCGTRWCQIQKISKGDNEIVYDLEVKDTHCFFANGILVHNCHHASSVTVRDVMMASKNAYWRYGCTATYAREDGEELVIQGLFGKKIVDISLSYLIKHNWLVPATVFFTPITFSNMTYQSYPVIYSHCVINNEEVNGTVAETAKYLESIGKSSLILVSKISHGKNIHHLIEGSLFLTGKDSSKKRNKAIDNMKTGKKKILIATTLADEGLDIKNLDVVHMVGAGASVTRVPQRIGRVVRKFPGKKYGIAIYYHYCVEHLYQQGLKAKRIIAKEPRINIKQTCGIDDLKGQLIAFMNKNNSLFA